MSIANLAYGHYASVRKALVSPSSVGDVEFMKLLSNKNIICIPIKMSFMLSYEDSGNNNFYYRFINTPDNRFLYHEIDQAHFEMPRPDFEYFTEQYGIDTIIADKQFLHRAYSNRYRI